jgi:hypothetical protein
MVLTRRTLASPVQSCGDELAIPAGPAITPTVLTLVSTKALLVREGLSDRIEKVPSLSSSTRVRPDFEESVFCIREFWTAIEELELLSTLGNIERFGEPTEGPLVPMT